MIRTTPTRIVVLISGSGSNLQAIIDAIDEEQVQGQVVGVISNKDNVLGLQRAAKHHIPTIVLEHKSFIDRDSFDQALTEAIDSFSPDLVVLAGFMRILGEKIAMHYQGRMFNIHPSLLPKYPGLHTHQRVLEAQDEFHGCSIHFVTPELDGGPVVAQRQFRIETDDTEQTLMDKVQKLEHKLYPETVELFCQKRLVLTDNGPLLDGETITRW